MADAKVISSDEGSSVSHRKLAHVIGHSLWYGACGLLITRQDS